MDQQAQMAAVGSGVGIEPKPQSQPQRGSEFAGFWAEQNLVPGNNKPVELPRLPRQPWLPRNNNGAAPVVAQNSLQLADSAGRESCVNNPPKPTEKTPFIAANAHPRKTTLAVDRTPGARSTRFSTASGECVQGGANSATVHSVESLPRQRSRKDAAIQRVDDASILSSRRSANNHSSRSSCCQAALLEETIKNNPPHILPQPPPGSIDIPIDDIKFPGSTKCLAQLRTGTHPRHPNSLSLLSKEPALGGSCRETRSWDTLDPDPVSSRAPASLPTSPCSSSIDFIRALKTSKESRASKLLRRLTGVSLWDGNAVASQSGHSPRTRRPSRWLFKWKWSPSKAATNKTTTPATSKRVATGAVNNPPPRDASPTANIMSDARPSSRYTKSDRFASGGRVGAGPRHHMRGASWGCASHASTATLTQCATRNPIPSSRFQDDNGGSRIEEAYRNFQESFRSVGTHSFRSVGTHSFRSVGGQSFRSVGGQSFRSVGGQSFRSVGSGSRVFEDCHGSFRSTGSPGSYGSFRSVDSPRLNACVEETEWDSRLPPPLQQGNQNPTKNVDVASLCDSSLKFVYKCREIRRFNWFLKTQKKRILRGFENGNTDCFHVILSGTDVEVSSLVTAMCHAWFLENTVAKVTGKTWHAVPVIDIPRHQMHKHKDAAWLFDACGIDAAALLFADEIEMASLAGAGRVKTSAIGQDVLVTRNEVGSVCTLLGEKLLAEAQCLLELRYMKTLLLAGILLDTENLDFASMRDTEMTTVLLVGSGSLGRNGFFNQLKGVEDDERVSKFITRNYGDDKLQAGSSAKVFSAAQSGKTQDEADQEQFDKDSLFTPSQDQTSTSEAGTTSSLDEDSPRLKQRSGSFQYTKLQPLSAPATRSHQGLPPPSGAGCDENEIISVAVVRKAATTRSASAGPACGARSPGSSRTRKKLFLYQA